MYTGYRGDPRMASWQSTPASQEIADPCDIIYTVPMMLMGAKAFDSTRNGFDVQHRWLRDDA